MSVEIYDPYVKPETFIGDNNKYSFINEPKESYYDAVVIAVTFAFVDLGIQSIKRFGKSYAKIFDIKSLFPKNETDFKSCEFGFQALLLLSKSQGFDDPNSWGTSVVVFELDVRDPASVVI